MLRADEFEHLIEHEKALWLAGGLGVFFVGLFARFLDELEERRVGQLALRHTNMFCATFTLTISCVYFSIIFIQAGKANFKGFFGVLVGKEHLSALEEFQARVAHALMLAYMIQDLIGRFFWKNLRITFVVHHFASVIGLVNCLFLGQSGMFGAAAGLSEFTTPLVSMLEIARIEKLHRVILPGGILLNFLFPLRVLLFTYFTVLWVLEHQESPFFVSFRHQNFMLNLSGTISFITLTCLNWNWYWELLKLTIKTLTRKSHEQKKET